MTVSVVDIDSGPAYFNGTTWTTSGGPFPLAAQGTVSNWTFNNANFVFVTDHRYNVTATATDAANNATPVTHQFIYDVSKPASSFTTPSRPTSPRGRRSSARRRTASAIRATRRFCRAPR